MQQAGNKKTAHRQQPEAVEPLYHGHGRQERPRSESSGTLNALLSALSPPVLPEVPPYQVRHAVTDGHLRRH